MARPQSNEARQARILDNLLAQAPWLPDDDRQLMDDLRASLVRKVEHSAKGRAAKKATDKAALANAERPKTGRKRGG